MAGCGGDSPISAPGVRAITVVGGAEGAVMNLLAPGQRLAHAPIGANLENAQAILLDGDHVAPRQLGSLRGLKAAVLKGTPLILVDASEALKDAVVEAIGAPGSTGGTSPAIAFARLRGGGEHDFRIHEISDTPMRVESSTFETKDGVFQGNPVVVGNQPRVLTADKVRAMLAAVGSASSDDPLIPEPPSLSRIPTFYAEYSESDGGIANAALNDQVDSINMVHCYRGYLDKPMNGDYRQILVELVDGQSRTGKLVRDSFFIGTKFHYGWTQAAVFTSTKFAEKTSLNERIEVGPLACLISQGPGKKIVSNLFQINSDEESFVVKIEEGNLDLHGWDAEAASRGSDFDIQYVYRQTKPWDGLQENYSTFWDTNVGRVADYPTGSIDSKRVYRCDRYYIDTPLKGQVIAYTNVTRRYVDAALDMGDPRFPSFGGRKDLDGGSARMRRLNFRLIAPP
ncbi:hypothetical protein EON81_22600 [bacterium]|nr:MAG: hypothetical protein EON81_22600 [bacterium]